MLRSYNWRRTGHVSPRLCVAFNYGSLGLCEEDEHHTNGSTDNGALIFYVSQMLYEAIAKVLLRQM